MPANCQPSAADCHDPEYQRAIDYLYGRLNFERTDSMPYGKETFKLDRMRQLVARLGHPDRTSRIVHVAGTKGKGSTCHFLSAMLTSGGLRCGCYTSPHLLRVEERFAVNGEPCSPADLIQLVEYLKPTVEELDQESDDPAAQRLTFFEITTAMAMVYFAWQNVDVVVLEVGLGGRLDSTNVCHPEVCIITSISFDHMRQLGHTLAAIAGEKAGIIKSGVPVVTGVQQAEPWEVIRTVAQHAGAPVRQLGTHFDFEYHPCGREAANSLATMDYFHCDDAGRRQLVRSGVQLPVLGRHQAANASLAWAACELLNPTQNVLTCDAIELGIQTASCPARIEQIGENPVLLVDTAHNAASIGALVSVLRESFPQRPRTLILGATQGKDVDGMLRQLVPEFDRIVCTRYQSNPRGMDARQLAELIQPADHPNLISVQVVPTPAEAWRQACQQRPSPELICATGSFFLAAEMKQAVSS